MLIGSNNTLAYLRPSSWWSRIFKWFGRNQEIPYDVQYTYYGIRLFDFRLKVDKGGHILFMNEIYEMLDFFESRGDAWVRITLDAKKEDIRAEKKFKEVCKIIDSIYQEIKFYGGYRLCDKTPIYEFDWERKKMMMEVVSPPEWSRLYRTTSKWLPCLIHRLNRSYIEEYKKRFCFLMLDYVNRH